MGYRRPLHIAKDMLMSLRDAGSGGGGGGGLYSQSERINNNFGDYNTGSGVPTGWTRTGTTTNISESIDIDGSSPGGQCFTISKTSADTSRVIYSLDNSSGSDMSALMTFEANVTLSVGVYINYNESTQDGFLFEIDYVAGNIKAWRVDAGSFTQIGSGSFTMSVNTKYHMRLVRDSAGNVRCRIWAASIAEPTTWTISLSGATQHTSGKFGIDVWSDKTYTAKIHRISYGHNGNQGCILDDDQFNNECLYASAVSDDSIRYMDINGSNQAFIAWQVNGNPQALAIHNADQTVYCAVNATGIVRFDRWGTNRTLIAALVDVYGVTVKEATDQIFYTIRHSAVSRAYSNSKNGGSQSEIWSEAGFFEAGEIYYNTDDDRLYLGKHPAPLAMETDGSNIQTYANFSDCLTIVADGTNVYAGTWNANNLSSIPLAGGTWTSRDATSSIWGLQFNSDKSKMYGGNADGAAIINWSAIPPSAANRSTIASITSANDLHTGYANFI